MKDAFVQQGCYVKLQLELHACSHLLLSELTSPLTEVDVGLPQDDMGVTSANTLGRRQTEGHESECYFSRSHTLTQINSLRTVTGT